MKLNNKMTLATLVSLVLSTTAIADTASDPHTVTTTVAPVKLLDIADAGPTITMTPPTEAGANFTEATDTSTLDITSNIASGTSNTRTLTVAADAALPSGWQLEVSSGTIGTGNTGATATFNDGTDTTPQNLVTGIQNVMATGHTINYKLLPESPSVVPEHKASQAIELTFTLGDDSGV